MYYPLLRGRQNELLAIRELLDQGILTGKVVPIIEPVKLSPTLVNTIEDFANRDYKIVLINNPQVGSFQTDAKNTKNIRYRNRLDTVWQVDNSVIRGHIVGRQTKATIDRWVQSGVDSNSIMALCLDPDSVYFYEESGIKDAAIPTVVPYTTAFRRIRGERILLEDKFSREERNANYSDNVDQFFSSDHLYYLEDGYCGFSDYSIIGQEYFETGFAPYAVAIHIVYFDDNNELRIHHFVSDSNDDITDPAGKFYEALEKLVQWNADRKIDTLGMKRFEHIFNEQSYPGLGVVKKLSIMHHLELMERYLNR